MTPRQYRNALDKLGLTQREFARRLGISLRISTYWAAGDGPIPFSTELVLRYWLETGIPPEEITPIEDLIRASDPAV